MNAIERLPEATAASIQASLLAVTVQDICRILFRHVIERCKQVFGTPTGRISFSIDYVTWSITAALDVDHSRQLSSASKVVTLGSLDQHELELLSHLGFLHVDTTSSSGTTVSIWKDGKETRSHVPLTPLVTPPPISALANNRGVIASIRDVFSGMPVRRKFIATEATKKSSTDSLVHCVRELSLLSPDATIFLSLRHAARSDGTTPVAKVLLHLPRAKDLVHRCQSAFGVDCVESESVRIIAAEHIFTSIKMEIDGFVCQTPTMSAPQIIFMQGRTWPGAASRVGTHQSERDCAAFASLLSSFELAWTDEPVHRHTRHASLSPDLYRQVCKRILAVPGVSDPGKGSLSSHTFVLNVMLARIGPGESAETQREEATPLTASSFQAALLDAICSCSVAGTEASSTLCKRKRPSRPSTAVEPASNGDAISPIRARPATASLAVDSFGLGSPAPEGMMEWRDPVNGRLFHIDRRTGHSIAVRPASARLEAEDVPAVEKIKAARRGRIVDRSKLNKGLQFSPSKQRANTSDNIASDDEFDDASLDAALASIPSPSPAASVDVYRKSRFFDSRRPQAISELRLLSSKQSSDQDNSVCRPNASDLELAITRLDLQQATVLDQVDGKFILCSASPSPSANPILFCIDQHAADERYRLERLLEDYVSDCASGTSTHILPTTLTLGINTKQYELITKNEILRQGLAALGWAIQTAVLIHPTLGHAQLDLIGIPHILKEKTLTLRGRVKDQPLLQSTFENCLLEMTNDPSPVQVTTVADGDWVTMSRMLPSSLMELVKSTACRSAIMFNDQLSKEASERLVRRLATCKFPFGCAHGRPTLVPLCQVEIGKERMM
ncbi:related to MLH3 - insertion and deletion mismatch repair protein [Ustilago trichophora]|uniref:Related to MLH3 - insertion and deletion mismatch repair protein n=1 Tax=Ustilago trichophora TaxID=86804 RepID=A0A5C3EPY9_9BASI|nr:related to MLH3 - insertion and deletion mismatch repair protein [Ustilago trichophora]